VAISNDTGTEGDRITNNGNVKVILTLADDSILASDESLEVSADGINWVVATGSNRVWATADDAVTLISGTNKTLTARVIDTAKLTLTTLSLVIRSLPNIPASLLIATGLLG
jgi:hypothetical protein